MTWKNLLGTTKAVHRGEFKALNAYIIKKKKKSQINDLTFHLNKLDKQQIKPTKQKENKKDQNSLKEQKTRKI